MIGKNRMAIKIFKTFLLFVWITMYIVILFVVHLNYMICGVLRTTLKFVKLISIM